ncbi:MAG: hypothetical protein WCD86_25785, partial [Ktedonobacteraceae bacterium]
YWLSRVGAILAVALKLAIALPTFRECYQTLANILYTMLTEVRNETRQFYQTSMHWHSLKARAGILYDNEQI